MDSSRHRQTLQYSYYTICFPGGLRVVGANPTYSFLFDDPAGTFPIIIQSYCALI